MYITARVMKFFAAVTLILVFGLDCPSFSLPKERNGDANILWVHTVIF